MIGVFAIVLRDSELLLIERGTDPHKGHWCPPGGLIDEGESPEEAVIRETREETGIKVSVVEKLGDLRGPITGRKHGVFLCASEGGRLDPEPPETVDARWVAIDELSSYGIPSFILDFLDEWVVKQL